MAQLSQKQHVISLKFRFFEKATKIWPIFHSFFFWHCLAVSNYIWKMGQLVVAFSKYLNFMNYYNDWIRNWKDFLIFLEQYEMELTIYFLFCLLSGAHRPHCPKATKLTYVWCNLKKNPIPLKMMHEQKYKACLSQSISATKTKKWWFHFLKLPNY